MKRFLLILTVTLTLSSCNKSSPISFLNKSEFTWKTDNQYFAGNKDFSLEEKYDNDGTLYRYIGTKELSEIHFTQVGIALTKKEIPEAITLSGQIAEVSTIKNELGKTTKEQACSAGKISFWKTKTGEEVFLVENIGDVEYKLFLFNNSIKSDFSKGVSEDYAKISSELDKSCSLHK